MSVVSELANLTVPCLLVQEILIWFVKFVYFTLATKLKFAYRVSYWLLNGFLLQDKEVSYRRKAQTQKGIKLSYFHPV